MRYTIKLYPSMEECGNFPDPSSAFEALTDDPSGVLHGKDFDFCQIVDIENAAHAFDGLEAHFAKHAKALRASA